MSEPFLAEVRIVGFNFAPRGWALCDGQVLPISQNQSLYSLIGTTYGGDGRTSFALPDLRGRTPVHVSGSQFGLGGKSGEETHTLTSAEMPQHNHLLSGTNADATTGSPTETELLAAIPTDTVYSASGATPTTFLAGAGVAHAGGGQAHDNMQPYIALNFVIALRGLFPSRN